MVMQRFYLKKEISSQANCNFRSLRDDYEFFGLRFQLYVKKSHEIRLIPRSEIHFRQSYYLKLCK